MDTGKANCNLLSVEHVTHLNTKGRDLVQNQHSDRTGSFWFGTIFRLQLAYSCLYFPFVNKV